MLYSLEASSQTALHIGLTPISTHPLIPQSTLNTPLTLLALIIILDVFIHIPLQTVSSLIETYLSLYPQDQVQ